MAPSEEIRDEFGLDAAKRREIGLVGLIEAIASILLMYFVCLLVLIFGLGELMSRQAAPWGRWLQDLGIWAAVVVGSGSSARFISRSLQHATHPVLPSIAMRQRLHLILRPVVGAWWIVAAVCIVLLAQAQVAAYGWFGPSWQAKLVKYGVTFFVLFCSAVASNLYLLSGMWALTRSASLVMGVWRLRFAIDLGVVLFVSVLDLRLYRFFRELMGP